MRLKLNENAPSFKKEDLKGELFDLNTPRERLLMISFFRYASCPLCNMRVNLLIKEYENLKNALDIVMIFHSPKEKIDRYVGRQKIPYRIIADENKHIYALYGIEDSWIGFLKAWTLKIKNVFLALFKYRYMPGSVEHNIHTIPADIIIDKNNTIIRAFYGKDIGDHLPIDEIKELVNKYETG